MATENYICVFSPIYIFNYYSPRNSLPLGMGSVNGESNLIIRRDNVKNKEMICITA